jgi:Glycosyl transferase 4-like domain
MIDYGSKLTRPIHLLAVSFYYPPANNPRAVQVARLLEHLNLSTLLVCAANYPTDDRIDRNLSPLAEDFLQKFLRVPFSQRPWKRLTARVAYPFNIRLWEQTPDRYIDWKPSVLRALNDNGGQSDFKAAVIVTFGSPMSDHLIGLELKARYGIPWIAHFSDPWIENPFKSYNWFTKSLNVSLERKVVEAADRLVYTSQETADIVLRKFPENIKSKARILPHAFDARLYQQSATSNSQITIRYLGDLYGSRTPAPLFRALQKIVASAPALLKDVCFEFVGSIADFRLTDIGYDQLPEGMIVFRPTVDYLTSLSLMSSADGLLVIDAPAETSVFLPSKLIDYIGAGRPVLGITPPGTASKLITALGGWVADPTDAKDTESEVLSFISFLRHNRIGARETWGEPTVRQRFDAAMVAGNFGEMIDELVPLKEEVGSLLKADSQIIGK